MSASSADLIALRSVPSFAVFTAVSLSSTASLMSLVAPFLAGIVGKEAAKSGFSTAGLTALLAH